MNNCPNCTNQNMHCTTSTNNGVEEVTCEPCPDEALRQEVVTAIEDTFVHTLFVNFDHDVPQLASTIMELFATHYKAREAEIEKAVKQKMAMCTDDKTFLEEHQYANAIEYDEKLKRPSRAIYHNRQWEAERDGLNTLAALGIRLNEEPQL